MITEGFDKFQQWQKLKLYPKIDEKIERFYQCVLTIGYVLNNCTDDQATHLKSELNKRCQSEKFRGIYYEFKILGKLLMDGLKINSFPESCPQKNKKNISIPDAIVSKNGKLLQVECKTISASKGHPIIQEAAKKLLDLLVKDSNYNEICPNDHYCHIEYCFDKCLVNALKIKGDQNVYTPKTLFEQFKLDLENGRENIKITTNQKKIDVKMMNDIESPQSFRISYDNNNNIIHHLTLTSSVGNKFYQSLYDLINKAVTKVRKPEHPLILCLELYEYVHNEKFENNIKLLFHQHIKKPIWVIISDRVRQEGIVYGRKPIEFCTKAMTKFLTT